VIHYKIPGGVTQKSVNRKEIKMELIFKTIGLLLAGFAVLVVFGLLLSLPVMLLWNLCLVPAIPGLAQVGWLQAWGILILCGLLFKPTANNSKSN
jgi:hypothetical protein